MARRDPPPSCFLLLRSDYCSFSDTPSGLTVQIHRQRKTMFPVLPPLPPPLLLLCSHVMTLIIVFFSICSMDARPESITHPFSLETWSANPHKATFHLGPLTPCTFLHQQHILLIFFLFFFPRGITYFSIISYCTFRTCTSLKNK